MTDDVSCFDKLMILYHINDQISKGNFDFAEELRKDAIEYLKETNKEFEWLEKDQFK